MKIATFQTFQNLSTINSRGGGGGEEAGEN